MKFNFLLFALLVSNFVFGQSGFNNIRPISTLSVTSSTADVTQSKTWLYAGKYWSVMSSSSGTNIYRLDGSTWTRVLTLASGNTSFADVKVVGNVVHIFTWRGRTSYLYSVQYDVAAVNYRLWTVRSSRVTINLESGVTTGTIDIDGTGRMWLASNGTSSVFVRWSDAPYSTWSAPITLATGLTSTDVGAVVAMPALNSVGVFWSNKTTKRFGFRTHVDGASPASWSADEVPASQSAQNINGGFAENQFNLKVLSNGTLFSVVKTGYIQSGAPQLQLLIRRPNGTWDFAYTITTSAASNPILAIKESLNKVSVFYTQGTQGIAYKSSSTNNILFGQPVVVINGSYSNASTSKANYDSSVIVIASTSSISIGMLADDSIPPPVDNVSPVVSSINRQMPVAQSTNSSSVIFRVLFSEPVVNVDPADFTLVRGGNVNAVLAADAVTVVSGTNNTTFDVQASAITGNGSLQLNLNASATGITDTASNPISGGYTTGQIYTIQQSPPTLISVSIASNNANTTLAKPGDVIRLTFTASEPINTPVVYIANRPVTTIQVIAANSFEATNTLVEADATGTIPFTIDFSTPVGTIGNTVNATTDLSAVSYDKSLPQTLSIVRYQPLEASTIETAVTYSVTFSEQVQQVDASDFSLAVSGTANGVIASDAVVPRGGSGNIYDVTVSSVTGNGEMRLDLNAAGTGITDAASNMINTGFSTGESYTIANPIILPTLASVSITSANANPAVAIPGDMVSLSFTGSQPLNNVAVNIATNTVVPLAGGGNTYMASYTLTANDVAGQVPFSINFTNAQGTAGNTVTTTTDGTFVIFDKTTPSVTSINRQVPLTQSTNASSLTYRVVFSEAVANVDVTDFALNVLSGSVAGSISNLLAVGTNGTTYDVSVYNVSGIGDVRLDLNATNTSIKDIAGNNIVAGFNTGESYSVNNPIVLPTLSSVSITSANANPAVAKPGDIVSLAFTGSQPLTNVAVTIATNAVVPVAGSGNAYTATYTLTVNDIAGQVPFTINFSNAQGTAGNQVTTTTNGTFVVFDKAIPSVLSINRQVPLVQSTSASSLTYRAVFSEPVANVDVSDFTLNVLSGSVAGSISTLVTVGTDGTTYDVSVNNVSGNGVVRLDLIATNTGIKDIAGNDIGAGFTTGETYTITPVLPPGGFTSIVPLQPLDLSQPTKDKPQAKAWFYANQWWCVLSVTAGTKLFRLDGTAWTDIQLLNNKTSKPECRIDGDRVHVLCYKGGDNNTFMYTLQYDPATNTYKPWVVRPIGTVIVYPSGSETATLAVDGTGRLWTASDGITDIKVWYSDAPYTSWSAPITIANNIKSDDICAITYIPALQKIGIFWSNQVTKRFGFRTHDDGTDPAIWTNDELPASQSALNVTNGMADDHMNIKVAANGTLYVSSKTSYNRAPNAKVIMLVRRPNGVWDNQYTVTIDPEGTQSLLLLNEQKQKIRIIYCTLENGGDLLYRESDMANISFGAARTLVSNPGMLYNYPASSYQNFTSEVLVIATDVTAVAQKAVSFLLRDETVTSPVMVETRASMAVVTDTRFAVYPNPITAAATVSFSVATTGQYVLTLFNVNGARQTVLRSGWAQKGVGNTITISSEKLSPGMYYVNLKTANENKTIKVMVNK